MTLPERLGRLWRSLLGLPRWLQVWLAVLVGVNLAALWLLDTPVGLWTALAFLVVAVINTPTMVVQGGLTRLLSFPHVVWAPLLAFILYRLFGPEAGGAAGPEFAYGVVVIAVNGISLVFDVYDGYRWLRGEREILGIGASS